MWRCAFAGWSLVFGIAVASCAGPPSEATAPREPEAAPGDAAEPEEALTLSGSLVAHDGGPLAAGEVKVLRGGIVEPLFEGPLGEDGSFRLELPGPGVYMVTVSAVDHAQMYRELLVTGPVRIEGRLGTYRRDDPGEETPLKVEYVGANDAVVGRGTVPARQVEGPRYRAELKPPEGATAVRYQLAGLAGGRTFNGPGGTSHVSDGGGDYWAVRPLTSDAVLELDLSGLPPAGRDDTLQWSGLDAVLARVQEVVGPWSRKRSELMRDVSQRSRDPNVLNMTDADRAALRQQYQAVGEALEAEEDPAVRAWLRVKRVTMYRSSLEVAEWSAELVRILDEIPPLDPRWALEHSFGNLAWYALEGGEDPVKERVQRHLDAQRQHSDPGQAGSAYQVLLGQADASGDADRVEELYREMVADTRLHDTYAMRSARERFDPDRILKPGKPFPELEMPALEADADPIRSADREGTLYLVEFWATWCGPCVGEMPLLHEAYAEINGARPRGKGEKGLRRLRPVKKPRVEFVWISLDDSPETVRTFREKSWSMPWTHAFGGLELEKELNARFGFSAVPTAVLVDGDGKILETGGSLRREQLLPTLKRVLAEAAADGSGS